MAEARVPAARLGGTAGQQPGTVTALYTCARGGEPMIPRDELSAVAGVGIEGDRYANGHGFWSFDPKFVDHITFVEGEAIAAVSEALALPFAPHQSRRNVITAGIRLEALIGRRFSIGDAAFVGLRPCDPCAYLDRLLGMPVRVLFAGRGGLRAAIVRSGTIRIGAVIRSG